MRFKRSMITVLASMSVLFLAAGGNATAARAEGAVPSVGASAASGPSVTGRISIRVRLTRQCRAKGETRKSESNVTYSGLRVNRAGNFHRRDRVVSGYFARLDDIDGRVNGRNISGWLRSVDTDHDLGSGAGGSDCSTGTSPWSAFSRTWLRFRGRSLPGKPRVFRIATGAPGTRPANYRKAKRPRCAGKPADYVGTNRSDRIRARRGSVVVSRGGNDRITGNGLTVCSGKGNDVVRITGGDGMVLAGPGNDLVKGGPGWNEFHGGPGDDRLIGGPDANWMFGGPGSDRITGSGVIFG